MPGYDEVNVGNTIQVGELSIFITEKGQAKVDGIEGEFVGKVSPNTDYRYIQGVADGVIYAIQFTDQDIKFLKGRHIDSSDISNAVEQY